MGRQIIKQPDGKYAIFSSIVDDFIAISCTPQEIINIYCEDYREDITKRVNRQIEQLDNNEKPYYQFTMTLEDAIGKIKEIHGDIYATEIAQMIGNKMKLDRYDVGILIVCVVWMGLAIGFSGYLYNLPIWVLYTYMLISLVASFILGYIYRGKRK